MTITVLIPTYRRPKDLRRCLEALKKQTRPADEVLVVVRDTDSETWTFLETFNYKPLPLRTVIVKVSGVVAALNAALNLALGDSISITDDDAAPRPDWLASIENHFSSDKNIGGVGGRDWVHLNGKLVDDTCEEVGRVQWFGRVIGNHHLGFGKAREVDVLKGVNMSYRRTAITGMCFDERMKGTGAQVHFELAFSLALKQAGWKLIYDPNIAVDHYPAQRFDEDQRGKFSPVAISNRVHNETLILLEYLTTVKCVAFLIWAIFVGTQTHRGLLQCLRFLPIEGTLSGQKWVASLQGRHQGWLTWKQSRHKTIA